MNKHTRGEKWYVNTIPPSGSRAKDTYIRERLKQRCPEIEQRIERALEKTPVYLTKLEPEEVEPEELDGNNDRLMRGLKLHGGVCIVEALVEEVREGGWSECSKSKGREMWGELAREHAQQWLQENAPGSHWNEIAHAIEDLQPKWTDGPLTMSRLAKLARKGSEFAKKLRRCEPWAAREACWTFNDEILDEDPDKWAMRAVQNQSAMLNQKHEVSEQDAQRALEHWRWPTMRPPLTVIATGAGQMRPLRSDSAWANGLNKIWNVKGNKNGMSIKQCRERDEWARPEAMTKVSDLAYGQMGAKEKGEKSAIIARCQREWNASKDLEGDGFVENPTLEAVKRGQDTEMMWVFDIQGPQTLLAGCSLEGKNIEDVLSNFDMNRIALAMTIERDENHGMLFERRTKGRKRKIKGGEALGNIARWTL